MASETSEIAELYVLVASLQSAFAEIVGSTLQKAAAPSATIPRIRILLIPRPTSIQAQPEGEGKG
jgi:hypothetical protein